MQVSPRYREKSLAVEAALRATFAFENEAAPFIVFDVNYWLFGELSENVPPDYCGPDPSRMIEFQAGKIERHLRQYDDAYIPYLMPWYGTGVLASAFGVPIKFQEGMDPAVDLPPVRDIGQLKDLCRPDPQKDGLMPRVLATIRAMRLKTDFPVSFTDCQGPLTTALQIVGYDNLIYWMYDHPGKVHDLLHLVTQALIDWVKLQKEAAGCGLADDCYALGAKIPSGLGGVWIADDDSVIFGDELYREFAVPYNSRILQAFGGGAIHYCGKSSQHVESFLKTEGLRAIHNATLDDLETAARLRRALAEQEIVFMVSDYNVDDEAIEPYYERLFRVMGTRGLIVLAYVCPGVSLRRGKYDAARRDPLKVGRAIEAAIRKYNRPR